MRRSALIAISPKGFWVDTSEPVQVKVVNNGKTVSVTNLGATAEITVDPDEDAAAYGLAEAIVIMINAARAGVDVASIADEEDPEDMT